MIMNIALKSLMVGLCALAPAFAQAVKPAESTSKVKKVLRFTKIGTNEYLHQDGQRDLLATLNTLATSKGFTLTNQANDAVLTESYLKDFQVIIWDNNVGNAVPATAARDAVMKYVNDGGGWLLVHGAGDHKNAWPAYSTALQTTFSTHGAQGAADVVMDPQGLAHKELKWMMDGWPARVRFTRDEWYSFQNSVRGRQNMVVVATAAGESNIVNPPRDGSNDLTYIFAREMGKGRLLYTAMGHGGNSFYTQADGFAVKALWEKMRYVAGDFQNGCTNRNASNYDSTARVDDLSCITTSISGPGAISRNGITVVKGAQRMHLNLPHEGRVSLEVRDPRGALVWSGVQENASEIQLGQNILPGVYNIIAKAGKNRLTQQMLIL